MPDDLVTVHVDGQAVRVSRGTNVVDAAHAAGVEIPIFCHHPRLAPVGMCRMCLVEVGTPKVNRETRQVELDEAGNDRHIHYAPYLDYRPMQDGEPDSGA